MTSFPSTYQIFKQSVQVFKKNFWTSLIISFFGTLAAIILSVLALIILSFSFSDLFLNLSFGLLALVVAVVIAIFQFWVQLALIMIVESQEKIGVLASFQKSRKYLLPYITSSIYAGLALVSTTFIYLLFLSIVLGVFGVNFAELYALLLSPSLVISNLALLFSSLILGLPGIVLLVWFSFLGYVIVRHDRHEKNLSILVASKELVRGDWWRIAWRLAIFFVGATILYFVANVIAVLFGREEFTLVNNLISVLLLPLFVFYTYQIYNYLDQIKGSNELESNKEKSRKLIMLLVGLGIVILAVLAIFVAISVL